MQDDLNRCAQEWNQHRIQHTKSAELPGEKPDLMYYLQSYTASKETIIISYILVGQKYQF